LRGYLESAVKAEWEEMAIKELGCEKKTSRVLQLQWHWYNYCVEIRCQDTTNGEWEDSVEWFVVWKSAIVL
jgi:hypothetical protein